MIARREFLMQTAGVVALGAKERAGYALPVLAGQPAPSTAGAAPLVTFDLEITITGLCLFLEAPSKMHVLMVAPRSPVGGKKVERHYPRVFYDAVHDTPGTNAGTLYRVVPLEGTILDLSGLTPPGPIPPISAIPGLLDVSKYTTHKLKDPELFPPPNLACRVALPAPAGSPQTPDRVGPWKLTATTNPTVPEDTPADAAWKVVWTVSGIQDTELKWKLTTLVPNTPVEILPPLQPITVGGNKIIKLTISNVVRGESYHEPPKCVAPDPNAKLTHFHAFRDLYANSGSWPDLIYTGTTPPVCPLGPSGTPYTCVPSGGH
jgi:hypothetical protein